jgi:3-dehydroquinate synthase
MSGAPPVALVGLPGSGKSTVGKALAARLGRPYLDADERIEAEAGVDIKTIFAERGEPAFRGLERGVCAQLVQERGAVCGLGGGAIVDATTRASWLRAGTVVWIDTPPAVCAARIAVSFERPVVGRDAVASLTDLAVLRGAAYRAAHLRVDGARDVDAIVDELAPALEATARLRASARTDTVLTSTGSYGVHLRPGALADVPDVLASIQVQRGPLLLVTQAPLRASAEQLADALRAAGFAPRLEEVPQGEAAKDLEVAARLFEVCAEIELNRAGAVLALGGGTVGDLAGYVAAGFKRGVPFVQIPTTLLSVVDSSVGGKVAVNLPAGKNLVGAFWPPRAVVVDPELLETLPPEEWTAGLAEVVKHGLLGDPGLLEALEARPRAAMTLARAIAVKRRVVEQDPDERAARMTLNLGHTFAHALERVAGYGVRHGHAVAVGLVAALALSEEIAGLPTAVTDEVEARLVSLGCPVRATGSADALVAAMSNDKKAGPRGLRFIVLAAPGDARVVDGVAEDAVRRAWSRVLGPPPDGGRTLERA